MIKVTAAVMLQDDHVFIARRNRNDELPGQWEFPGGKVEDGESLQECLKREMREEFHIDVSVGEFFVESRFDYPHESIHLMAFWTRWEKGTIVPGIHEECRWVKIKELDQYDFSSADRPIVKKLQEGLG